MTSKEKLKVQKEALLKDLKRSNQARKLKLAIKAGFKTVEEYFKYLTGKDMPVRKKAVRGAKINKIKEAKKANTVEEVGKVILKSKGKNTVETVKPTDIVIAFDTTGSMSSYIGSVKKHVTTLIPELLKKTTNLKISIVAFGDYIDMSSKNLVNNCKTKEAVASLEFGKAYQSIGLTDNEQDLINFVKSVENTSGGDSDEFYDLVLYKIRTETDWTKDSNKSILLIADRDPHSPNCKTHDGYNNKFDWKEEAKLLAKDNIKVDTLSILGAQWYKELSKTTGGLNLLFKSSEKTSQLLEGYTYARTASVEAFNASYSTVQTSCDKELITTYEQLFKTL